MAYEPSLIPSRYAKASRAERGASGCLWRIPGDVHRGLCGTSVLKLLIVVVILEGSLYNVIC
jgi:hypothetical protein